MWRITYAKRLAFLNLIEESGLALGDFLITSPDTATVYFQYRHDYFKYIVSQHTADGFKVTVADPGRTDLRQADYRFSVVQGDFRGWLQRISSDRSDMSKFFQRYASLQFEASAFLSSRFIEILRQAEASENYGLTEVSGMAYRKAFEVMMKDYVMIDQDDPTQEKIANTQIREVIRTYVNDDSLKLLSHGVLELGNDHAHYRLRYTDSNVAELKEMIRKAAHWILRHEELKQVEIERRKEVEQATEKFIKK